GAPAHAPEEFANALRGLVCDTAGGCCSASVGLRLASPCCERRIPCRASYYFRDVGVHGGFALGVPGAGGRSSRRTRAMAGSTGAARLPADRSWASQRGLARDS